MTKITAKQIAERADVIFRERYTVKDIMKMNVQDAHAICFEEARQELIGEEKAEIIKFVEYVNEFYGKGVGIYAEDFEGGGVTITQIHQATMQYIESGEPFQGDSVDREAVRTILQENYNPLK